MFRSDCYFTQRNTDTGVMEWFFHSREGVHGPYPSKPDAIETRAAYVAACRERGSDGSRKSCQGQAAHR